LKKVFSLAAKLEGWAAFVLQGTNVRCEVAVAPDLPAVEADEGQLHQVVSNLVLNARQAMPGGGTVQLRADEKAVEPQSGLPLAPGRYVRLTVEDRGVGILPEHLPRIFDPYFTTKQTGSGLGLSTAYSIVRRHGGHVVASSTLGRGSTFSVYLPASLSPIPQSREPATDARGGAGRVLVMDDEAMIRDVLADLLPDLGYEAVFAAEGGEAVEKYRAALAQGRPFDAVLLDLTVPGGMGGLETLAKLRELAPAVRAIASTGYASGPVLGDFAAQGFVAAIPKPYRPSDLARVLRAALDRPCPPVA
jgi:CheY-like chemotaxis protein